MPHIKLIAIDLDGTLLTSDRELSPGAVQAVAEALDHGVDVCLASGRSVSTIIPFADELGLSGPIVSCNGAYVLGRDREEVAHERLPAEVSEAILEYAADRGMHTNLYLGGDVYFSQSGQWAALYRQRTGIQEKAVLPISDLARLHPTKILFMGHPEEIRQYNQETSKLLGSGKASIVLSEPEYIEFLPPGINKAVGVERAALALSLHQNRVAALGDYLNDLEMVSWAGFSGAVANAVGDVREQADLLVASNNEGGAAEFIRAALRFRPGL
jgi:Cof subfamily protein (haloacid dehalogenase superfamily)